jgi:23S rRNA (cytosine1962-C5)-methyltransferase
MILEEYSVPNEYELLDSGEGERLERFGEVVLIKPDPAVLWKRSAESSLWQSASAVYQKKEEDRGDWQLNGPVPEKWLMHYGKDKSAISFYARLTPFKHTGVFPEQAANWDFITEQVSKRKEKLRVLNLFGYTGIASVLCAKLGCEVTHVDASKPSISWAKENMLASGLAEDSIRWILDDCLKFIKREVKRGNKYDAIIMDPPAFGRGAKGEVWKFNEDLPALLENTRQIVAENPAFVIVNAYAVSVSAVLLKNMLEDFSQGMKDAEISYGELILKQNNGRLLSTGIFGRLWSK